MCRPNRRAFPRPGRASAPRRRAPGRGRAARAGRARSRSRGLLDGSRLRRAREQPAETRDGYPDPVGTVIELVTHLVHRLLDEVGVELDAPGVRVVRQEVAPGGPVEVSPQVCGADPRDPLVRMRLEQLVRAFLTPHL